MAHLTSAPALRTARVVMKAYTLTVKPPETLKTGRLDGLTNEERHVATLIDHATNVFRVVRLRPELHYWQRRLSAGTATAPQVASFLNRILEEMESVPRRTPDEERIMATFRMPNGFAEKGMKSEKRMLSKPAVEASRVLFYYYDMAPIGRSGDATLDRLHVAELIDASIGLSRVMGLEEVIRRRKSEVMAGHMTEKDVRSLMRGAGIYFDKMPSYAESGDEAKILA